MTKAEYNKAWRARNPAKIAGYRARNDWAAKNPGRHNALSRSWTAANKQRSLDIKRAYRIKNAEKVKAGQAAYVAGNLEKVRAAKRKWARSNPASCVAILAKRRARKLQATPTWANQALIGATYERAHDLGLHVDHVLPLQGKLVCGLHVPFNLQLLTPEQNNAKGNRFRV